MCGTRSSLGDTVDWEDMHNGRFQCVAQNSMDN